LDIFFSSCFVQLNFWEAQTFKVLLPFIVLAVLMGVAHIFYKYQDFKHPGIFFNRALPNPIEKAVSLYAQGMVGLTTYIVTVGFAPFRCYRQIDGAFTLVPSSNLNCYDQLWFSQLFTIALGLVEIALIPLVLILIAVLIGTPLLTTSSSGNLEC
jgi:hypothetical protein